MSNTDQVPETTELSDGKVRHDHVDEAPIRAPIDGSSDYSDVAPPGDDQSASQKRRHQRGGRKKKSEGKLPSVSESRLPWSERNGRLKSMYGSQNDPHNEEDNLPRSGEDNVDDEDSDLERAADLHQDEEQQRSDGTTKPFKTGVRAFNIKKAESSGGRPIGVRVHRPKSKGKSKKQKKKKKTRSRSSDESEDEESEEEEPRKPLSIRLDLNLEIEIFLRAKVKGDITITFLE